MCCFMSVSAASALSMICRRKRNRTFLNWNRSKMFNSMQKEWDIGKLAVTVIYVQQNASK